jgi:hypothetical protein
MASARDKAFKILTEREICELLKDAAGRTPREVEGGALAKRGKRALFPLRAKNALFSVVGFGRWRGVDHGLHSGPASSLTYDESEGGTYPPYWGTWGSV